MDDTILGHHKIGDYHWYTSFENSNYFDFFEIDGKLKEGKEFKSHEEVIGLITTIHESYHLIQDLTLGHCAWVQLNADKYALSVYLLSEKTSHGGSVYPLRKLADYGEDKFVEYIISVQLESEFLNGCIYTSKQTDEVLDAENKAHKGISENLKPAYGLTGQDLIECHAAIMTERFLSSLIKRYPKAFNGKILMDLEPYFRVEKIKSAQKVLNIFNKYMFFIKFDTANKQHPLYPVCTRAAEYGFYLFILDYALHSFPVSGSNVDVQDLIPTIRFLKLAGSVPPCIMNLKNRSEFNLNEEYLYLTFMPLLVEFINKCNAQANKGDSFLMYSDITKKWISEYENLSKIIHTSGLISLFELFHGYRKKALSIIDKEPLYIYTSNIASLIFNLGITPFFSTNTIVGSVSPFIGAITEEQIDGRKAYKAAPNPYEVMDTFVGRELFLELSRTIFSGAPFVCPIVERLNFYPCKEKSGKCQCIDKPANVPHHCFARQVLEDYYPGFSK